MPYQPKPIGPPWKGVVDNIPFLLAPTSSFKTATGFFVEKQRIRSCPQRTPLPLWPTSSGPQIGERSFVDAIGNVHTVIMTATQAYYFVNGTYTLVASYNSSLVPVRTEVFQNVLIFTNGTGPPVTIDGSATSGTISLPTNGSCFYLGKLAGRMLYLNLIEPGPGQPGQTNWSRRFRWSKLQDPNNFTDFTSGVTDVPEIEDNISGYATQGALGYIYRTNGITVITPTGSISPTFFVENYAAGPGIGNFYPFSLAQWGNTTAFISQEEVQLFNPLLGPPQPIGQQACRSIFADLEQASGYVVGAFLPTLGFERQGLQYWISIPFANNTSKVWMFQLESQTWTNQTFPFSVTCMGVIAVS